nr:hypothetical protein L204_05535 [Cryptococcus depauperatus CBS 7855]
MSLGSLLERSRDALFTVRYVAGQEHQPQAWSTALQSHLGNWRGISVWVLVFAFLLFGAVMTNPSDSSFHSHLTELSFRSAMADFRRSEDEANDEHSEKKSPLPTSGETSMPPSISPLRFANRVAISLRTPTLFYRSFVILSVAITPPLQSPAYLSDSRHVKKNIAVKERHLLWLGTWGSWTEVMLIPLQLEWAWNVLTMNREKGRKRTVDRPGVFEVRQVDSEKEPTTTLNRMLLFCPFKTPPTPPLLAKASLSSSTTRHLRKSDSISNLESLPLHASTPSSPGSRRPSLANILSSPVPTPDVSSPILSTLKAELTSVQSVVNDLQNQFDTHEQFVREAHVHLQSTLDDLRIRRKEDDAERQELKTRTRSLEEQKRQAESARRDAEKKLRGVESVKDGLTSKIRIAERSIRDTRVQIKNSEADVKVLQEEGKQHVVDIRRELEQKKTELKDIEAEITIVEDNNKTFEAKVREAEEKLKAVLEAGKTARNIAPEEEMMMMAAAYEVAAQEGGYVQGYQQLPAGNFPASGSQAAAVIAEGIPHLGYDYTAKPTSLAINGFGHRSNIHSANDSARDLQSLRPYTNAVSFEDFGPGTTSASTSRRASQVHQLNDHEASAYGHDHGSPSGFSTSSSVVLLPQGLLSSLEEGELPPTGDDDSASSGSDSSRPTSVEQRPFSSHRIKHSSGSVSTTRLPLPTASPSLPSDGHPQHSTTPPLIPGPFAPTEVEKKALALAKGWSGWGKKWAAGGGDNGWPSGLAGTSKMFTAANGGGTDRG